MRGGWGIPPPYPLRGCRSTFTFSPLLSIPTVGKYPPRGTRASFLPMICPLRVKNTWEGGQGVEGGAQGGLKAPTTQHCAPQMGVVPPLPPSPPPQENKRGCAPPPQLTVL